MTRSNAGWAMVAWCLALCLTGGTAPAAGPTPVDPQPWYARILGKKSTDEKPPERTASAKPGTPLRPSIIIAPLSAEILSDSVKAEETACTRRLDACAKLREIASVKNDEPMLAQIDEIERQTIELCQARIARMGIRGTAARTSVVRATSQNEKPLEPAGEKR